MTSAFVDGIFSGLIAGVIAAAIAYAAGRTIGYEKVLRECREEFDRDLRLQCDSDRYRAVAAGVAEFRSDDGAFRFKTKFDIARDLLDEIEDREA